MKSYVRTIEEFANFQTHGQVYGIARSLFALSTLITFLFNPDSVLFPDLMANSVSASVQANSFVSKANLYMIFGHNLPIARMITYLVLVLVITGYRPRFTVLFHWWISSSFLLASPAIEGGDQLIAIITFLLIPIGLTDPRKWVWVQSSHESQLTPGLSFVLNSIYVVIRIQIFIVYLQAAIGKLEVVEWVDGTVLYYWFEDNIFGLNESFKDVVLSWLENYLVVSIMTYTVILFELILALAIAMTYQKRKPLLYLGFLFHLTIWFIHGLPTFFITMTGALILYIIPFYQTDVLLRVKNYFFTNTLSKS